MYKAIFTLFFIIAAFIIVGVIANYSISINAVPNLSDYLASTTTSVNSEATSTALLGLEDQTEEVISLKAPKKSIQVIVASTSEAMSLGLGHRQSLPENYGMLFFLPSPGKPGFWMKNMNFPIDIIWLNSSKKVVGLALNISPDSYPHMYFPPTPISYVLEINSGKANDFGIATGTILSF